MCSSDLVRVHGERQRADRKLSVGLPTIGYMEPTKTCSLCKITKPIEEGFGWRTEKGKRYARTYCRSCLSQRRRPDGSWIRSTEPIPAAPPGMARCGHCKQTMPTAEFTKNSRRANGRSNTCRSCVREWQQKRFADMTDEELAAYHKREAERSARQPSHVRKARVLKAFFNMTLGDYDRMYQEQNGLCAICGRAETATRKSQTLRLSV